MKTVSRLGRTLDVLGLLLFLGGGAVFVRAWVGFRGVQSYVPSVDAEPGAAVALADSFWRLQKIGGGVMLVGVAVFVIAWWVERASAAEAAEEPEAPGTA